MVDKLASFVAATVRLKEIRDNCGHALFTSDLNIAACETDLWNRNANLQSAGFLPKESAYFDRWVDVVRVAHPDHDGPYSWSSFRGKAFDNAVGWRIDYQIATPALAKLAATEWVDRAPCYADRCFDRAQTVVDYTIRRAALAHPGSEWNRWRGQVGLRANSPSWYAGRAGIRSQP